MSSLDESTGFHWPVRVYWEDTDAGGLVFYANYLRFMERARTEFLRGLGFEQDELREREGVLFAARHAALDFVAPARFNDRLRVSVELVRRGGASIDFRQEVRRERDGALLCRGLVKIACVNATTLRPNRIPETLLAEMGNVL